jgi:hypothetical protein
MNNGICLDEVSVTLQHGMCWIFAGLVLDLLIFDVLVCLRRLGERPGLLRDPLGRNPNGRLRRMGSGEGGLLIVRLQSVGIAASLFYSLAYIYRCGGG